MTTTPASRNAALLRAGVAVAAAIALLVGVLAMEEKRTPEAAPVAAVPAAPPAPVAPAAAQPAAPAVEPAAPAVTAVAPATPPAPAAEEAAAKAVPESAAPTPSPIPPEPAPIAPVVAPQAPQMPAPPTIAPPTVAAVEAQPVARVERSVAAPAPAPAPAPQALPHFPASAVIPAKDGYVLQLGVFGNPVNAGALQAELAAKGLPARVESRVVLGPFPDRKALDAAQRRLKREHRMEGVVVPPRNGR